MSISFIIWFLISAFLLVFWIWTLFVLYKQNRAWKIYAEKRKLRYYSHGFYDGSSISGALDGYKISIFTSEHSELDERSGRRLSAIEVNLHSKTELLGGIASGGMVKIIESIEMNREFKPKMSRWDDAYIIRTRHLKYMDKYLTDERLNKLVDLMEVDKLWVVLIFSGDTGLLRVDTPLPLDAPKQLDELVKKVLDTARVLELKEGEDKVLLREFDEDSAKRKTLDIDDDLLGDDIGLELED